MTTRNMHDEFNALPDEKLSKEEYGLADELQKLCSVFGEELKCNLCDSADVIMRLGKLYLRKACEQESPMHQKLSFIKCCALLNGAKVRFKMIDKPDKVALVNELLDQFSSSLYRTCSIENSKESLRQISDKVSKSLTKMRKKTKDQLSQLTYDHKEWIVENREHMFISSVQNLHSNVTTMYKSLMAKITKSCIELLGIPPCKFCQIGLGSLARGEITLYSDFEHVIILENEVAQDVSLLNKAKDYFRWFAVIFQIIIIGLGETFIRSVGVKSINDLYSDNRSKNWYFDVFTPCGISFDGMVPHSCMNPLGRQLATTNRKHKVELIQTAKKMANYLTTDENVKNGYYMKDILTRTCLVYGEISVYESFLSSSRAVLDLEDMSAIIEDSVEKISKNCNEFIRGARMRLYFENFNPKTTFYRPITALLSYMGRICEINASTSFDIVNELHKKGILNVRLAQKIKYAVAISCKIRMDAYVSIGNQRHAPSNVPTLELIGTDASWICYRIIQYLHIALIIIKEASRDGGHWLDKILQFNSDFFADNITEDVFQLLELGKFEEAAKLGEENLNFLDKKQDYLKLSCTLANCYCQLAKKCEAKKGDYCSRLIDICRKIIPDPDLPDAPKGDMLYVLAMALKHKGEFELSALACSDWFVLYRNSIVAREQHEGNYPKMLKREIKMRIKYMDPAKLRLLLRSMKLVEERKDGLIILRFGTALTELALKNMYLAKRMLSSLVKEFRDSPRETAHLINTLNEIAVIQENHGWLEDAFDTLKFLCQSPWITPNEKISVDKRILSILLKLQFWKEGLIYIKGSMTLQSKIENSHLVELFENTTESSILDQIKDKGSSNAGNKPISDIPQFAQVHEHLTIELQDMAKMFHEMINKGSPVDVVVNLTEGLPNNYTELSQVHHYSVLAKILIILNKYGYLLLKNNIRYLAKLAGLMVLEHQEYVSTLWKIVNSEYSNEICKNDVARYLLDYIATYLSSRLVKKSTKEVVEEYIDCIVNETSEVQVIENSRQCIDILSRGQLQNPHYYIEEYAKVLSIVILRVGSSEFDEVMLMLLDAPDEVFEEKTLKQSIQIFFKSFFTTTLAKLNENYNEVSVRRLGVLTDLVLQNINDSIVSAIIHVQDAVAKLALNEKYDVDGHFIDLIDRFSETGIINTTEYAPMLWKLINREDFAGSKRITKAMYYLINILDITTKE